MGHDYLSNSGNLQMSRKLLIPLLLLLSCGDALAQWQVPEFSTPLGRGPGKQGFLSVLPGAAGGVFTSNGPSALPSFKLNGIIPIPGGGTSNDTASVQSAATACTSAGGCQLVCAQGVTYTVDTIFIGTNTTANFAGCKFKQRTQGTSVFSLGTNVGNSSIGVTNVRLTNVYCIGNTVGTGLAAAISGDRCVSIYANSSNIWMTGSYITRFGQFALFCQQSTNIHFDDNTVFENAFGFWSRGCNVGTVNGNIINYTAMYSTTPVEAQLASAIAFESTDQNPYGVSSAFTVTGNTIKNFPYSQAIFAHALLNSTISGNGCFNVSICVSLNPYNLTDNLAYVTVSGNTGEGTNASTLPTVSDSGVVVNGGGCTGGCPLIGTVVGGSGYTDGIYPHVAFTGSGGHRCDSAGTPYIATATISISGGAVKSFTNLGVLPDGCGGVSTYVNGDVLSVATANIGGTGSGFTYTLTSASAGGTTPVIQGVSVTGNTMHAFNRARPDAGIGCFTIGYTQGLVMSGNTGIACGNNGFVFTSSEEGAIVTGNTAINPIFIAAQNCFLWLASPRAAMGTNMCSGANNALGVGYKVVGAVTDFKWKDSGGLVFGGAFDTTTTNSP